jgi:hypothetical protein
MLSGRTQFKTFSVLLDRASRSLALYARGNDPEQLHKFRVAVKKSIAIPELLGYKGGRKKFRKHFEDVSELFKIAGRIREAELNIKLFKVKNAVDKIFIRQLKQTILSESLFIRNQQPRFENIVTAYRKKRKNKFLDYTN